MSGVSEKEETECLGREKIEGGERETDRKLSNFLAKTYGYERKKMRKMLMAIMKLKPK